MYVYHSSSNMKCKVSIIELSQLMNHQVYQYFNRKLVKTLHFLDNRRELCTAQSSTFTKRNLYLPSSHQSTPDICRCLQIDWTDQGYFLHHRCQCEHKHYDLLIKMRNITVPEIPWRFMFRKSLWDLGSVDVFMSDIFMG